MKTLEQKIADAELKLQKLREQNNRLETGQKIVIGWLFIEAARRDKKVRDLLISLADKHLKRDADKKRIAPLIDELKDIPQSKSE